MNAKVTVMVLTIFLLAYFVLMAIAVPDGWKQALIAASPIILIGGVLLILHDRSYRYPELRSGEEFGYVDRPDLNGEKEEM
mgnify:CR=1 FL=1